MVFVSVVSPTTTVCGSFVGAVVGGGGGAASSVVLQSIVSLGIILFLLFRSGAFVFDCVKTHSGKNNVTGTSNCTVRTEESNRMNTHTCMSCIKQDTGISHT